MLIISAAAGAQETVLNGSLLPAFLVALAAGLISFFSPCVLPLVPGYLSYVAGLSGADATSGQVSGKMAPTRGARRRQLRRGGSAADRIVAPDDGSHQGSVAVLAVAVPMRKSQSERARTTWGGLLFVLGFSAVFVSYGAAFGAAGSFLIRNQPEIVQVMGLFTIAMGLLFAGAFYRVPMLGRSMRLRYRPAVGLAGAPLLGVMFGVGWTPCIGPTLAAVLTLAASSAGAGRGAVLSVAYCLGLGIPFLAAGASMQRVVSSFGWARRHARTVMRTGGAFLIIIGLLQVSGLWGELIARLQGLVAGWQVPL